MTILVVEDDADQLMVRAMLFKQNGFAVIEAASPDEALSAAAAQSIDCAVLDLRLPTEQEGLQLIRDLKTRCPEMAIYVLTGNRTLASSPEPEVALAEEIFVKGAPIASLLQKLDTLRSRLQDV